MQNLNQIRAYSAFSLHNAPISGKKGGEVVKKIPPLIMNNGLLATLAYALDQPQAWKTIFNTIADHLASPEIAIVPADRVNDTETLIEYLTSPGTSSDVLRNATDETMAWLEYARRFI